MGIVPTTGPGWRALSGGCQSRLRGVSRTSVPRRIELGISETQLATVRFSSSPLLILSPWPHARSPVIR